MILNEKDLQTFIFKQIRCNGNALNANHYICCNVYMDFRLFKGFVWSFDCLSAVLIIFEINRTEESTFKMTWITLIAIIPIFGALFYLFTRAQGVSMNIGDDYKTIQEANKKYLVQEEDVMKKYLSDRQKSGRLCKVFIENTAVLRLTQIRVCSITA